MTISAFLAINCLTSSAAILGTSGCAIFVLAVSPNPPEMVLSLTGNAEIAVIERTYAPKTEIAIAAARIIAFSFVSSRTPYGHCTAPWAHRHAPQAEARSLCCFIDNNLGSLPRAVSAVEFLRKGQLSVFIHFRLQLFILLFQTPQRLTDPHVRIR